MRAPTPTEMQDPYSSHRSLIDPAMKQRLNELVQTAKKYKTKACGMQKLIGLQAPSSYENEMMRLNRRTMKRKPPVPTSGRGRSGSRSPMTT